MELAPGWRVAKGPQHMCRIAPGEVLHRTVHCWHNRLIARGDSGLLDAGTIVVSLGDVVGWMVWVHFQSGASVKGACVSQPSPAGKNIWEGTLGPNAVFCCSVQYSDIQSQAKQFCDPASLALK